MTDEKVSAAAEGFERFRAALSRRLGDKVYSSWLSDLEYEETTDDCVTLSTGSEVKCDTIGQRFVLTMKDAWAESVGPVRRMRVVMRRRLAADLRRQNGAQNGADHGETAVAGSEPARHHENGAAPAFAKEGYANGAARASGPRPNGAAGVNGAAAPGADSARSAHALDDLASPVDESMTFQSFAVDETNSLAFAAVQQVFADGAPAEVVYINGPSGVGKSHLLFAVANEHRRRFGAGRCAYLTYAGLQSGCVDAVFSKSTLALQRELLARDVLLIDDIHFLDTSPRTQSELLNFLNAAMASGRRLVIAGELTPARLAEAGFNRRLTDRLSGGLSVSLLPGDAAHRARVLRKRLELVPAGPAIDDEAIAYIAEHFPNSLRETIGALKQLLLAYAGADHGIGRREAAAALRTRLVDVRRRPTFEELAGAVAAAFGLSYEEFMSRGQSQRLVRARHVFVIICRENLKESFPQIARFLKRDHTTMMSGYRRGQALIERDKVLQGRIAEIRETLGLAAG
jgi:chromosomal replication initiator protein